MGSWAVKLPYQYGVFIIRECWPAGASHAHWHVQNTLGEGFVCHTEAEAQAFAHGFSIQALLQEEYPDVAKRISYDLQHNYPRDDLHIVKLNSNGRAYEE
jgi:hypothetical protein